MSCVPLTNDQRRILDLLARGEPVPDDLAPVLEQLRAWGWVIGSGEMAGVGWSHYEGRSPGSVGIHDRY